MLVIDYQQNKYLMQQSENIYSPAIKDCDLIISINHDVRDSKGLIDSQFESGCIYLGGVKALSPEVIKQKNIKSVLTLMNDR